MFLEPKMNIHAINVFTGEPVEVRASNVIEGVDDLIGRSEGAAVCRTRFH